MSSINYTVVAMGDAKIWAENGGLLGLVIFALFGALATFFIVLNKKDNAHSKFISTILKDEREERHVDRTEHRETYDNLSSALRDLTKEIGNHRERQDRAVWHAAESSKTPKT